MPSALDNRPLNFDEFYEHINQAVFVSATPGDFEKEHSAKIVEQVIRPTGLLDPLITVKPTDGQMDDLISEINKRTESACNYSHKKDGGGFDRIFHYNGYKGSLYAP